MMGSIIAGQRSTYRAGSGAGPVKTRGTIFLARRMRATTRHLRRDLLRLVMITSALTIVLLGIITPALASDLATPLPPLRSIPMSIAGLPQDMVIEDRNGTPLADIGSQGNHRIVEPLGRISPLMLEATIAIEDRTFYTNSGIDVFSIIRAAVADIESHRIVQGGSTISQQLAKQLFIGPNAPETLQRKLKEAILALWLTRHYSKNAILDAYLNTIYYGNQAYGAEAAARVFFHTDAAHLNLAQASLLAGLPRAPTMYNPMLNPSAAHARQQEVLAAMVRQGDITAGQARQAAATPVHLYPPTTTIQASHFVHYVLDYLKNQFGITPGSPRAVKVVTSLDLTLENEATAAVRQQVSGPGNYYNFHDAALVSLDPTTGEVLAMVGSAPGNRITGQINMATSPTRQVGSAFKIFTYTAAIESEKVNMVSPILDSPLDFPIGGPADGPYAPVNYDGRWHGIIPLKMAVGNSLNIPAIKTELYTGIPAVVDVARRMGVTTLTQSDSSYGPSLTLGAYPVSVLDMAVGAATLANLGVRHQPAPILSITDALGRTVYQYDPRLNAIPAVSPQVAYIMGAILSDDRNRWMEFGPNGDLTLAGRQVAAKTGTSQEFRDNWTLGYTPTLATAVWVGNPDYTPLSHSSTGIVGAAPIWHAYMSAALHGVPNEWYPMPSGVDQVGSDYFLPGTENLPATLAHPWPVCPFFSYDPNQLTWSSISVEGVPCTLGVPERLPFWPFVSSQQ